jgi:hypothetical protein
MLLAMMSTQIRNIDLQDIQLDLSDDVDCIEERA